MSVVPCILYAMNGQNTTIDELLTSFFREQRAQKSGLRLTRILTVEKQLREFLELEGDGALEDDKRAVLEAEREFNPDNAFVRIMHASDLVRLLGGFIDLQWLPDDHVQCGVQLSLLEKLLASITRRRLIRDLSAVKTLMYLDVALLDAKRDLRMRRLGVATPPNPLDYLRRPPDQA